MDKRLDEELHPATGTVTFAISHRHAVIANGPAVVEHYINQCSPAERVRRKQRLERGLDDPETQSALRIYDRFLADMETQLSQTHWLAGDRFSLAEVGVIPYVNRLDILQLSDCGPGRGRILPLGGSASRRVQASSRLC